MKSLIRFSSHFPQMQNPDLSTPWSRYRHGCDPPNSWVSSECLPSLSTPHQLFVEPYSAIYSIPQFFTDRITTVQKLYSRWPRYLQAIHDRNLAIAKDLGISGTPGFILGTELVPGALDLNGLKALIERAGNGK
jgi:hypothetical protein